MREYWNANSYVFRGLVVLLLLASGASASANPWVDTSVFSMNETQLKAIFPALKKLAEPRIAAGGLSSQWSANNLVVAGHSFETVLYGRNGALLRIERVWSATGAPCLARAVFDDVVAELNTKLGPFNASDPGSGEPHDQRSTVWAPQGTDLIAYLHEANMQCTVRLVNRPHMARDASAL